MGGGYCGFRQVRSVVRSACATLLVVFTAQAQVPAVRTFGEFSIDCQKLFPSQHVRGDFVAPAAGSSIGKIEISVPKMINGTEFLPFVYVFGTTQGGSLASPVTALGAVKSYVDIASPNTQAHVVSLDSQGRGSLNIPVVSGQAGQTWRFQTLAFNTACNGGSAYSASYPVDVTVGTTLNRAATSLQSSFSQHGVTFSFAQPVQVGKFVNDNYFVIIPPGGVQVTRVTPDTYTTGGRTVNGLVKDPNVIGDQFDKSYPNGNTQGLDSYLDAGYNPALYSASKNLGTRLVPSDSNYAPLTITQESSLMKAVSNVPVELSSGEHMVLKTLVVLTFLHQAPYADAFSPQYMHGDKKIYTLGDVNFEQFKNLTPTSSMPSMSSLVSKFNRRWVDFHDGWISRYMHADDNMPNYYREFTSLYGSGALAMNLNASLEQRRDFFRHFGQIGLDWGQNVFRGAFTGMVNGHCNGKKFPIMLTGLLFGIPEMLNIAKVFPTVFIGPGNLSNQSGFSEDGQTFTVENTNQGVNWGYGGYNFSHVGMAEWGNFHTENISQDTSAWPGLSGYRICCSANGWVGSALALRVMGMGGFWGNSAFLPYMDRYLGIETGWTRSWVPAHGEMWDAYRSQY